MTLAELENGDIFKHAKDKRKTPKVFVVYGNPYFNSNDFKVRNCKHKNEIVHKMCNLEVVKIGESVYKERIQNLFDNQQNVSAI